MTEFRTTNKCQNWECFSDLLKYKKGYVIIKNIILNHLFTFRAIILMHKMVLR